MHRGHPVRHYAQLRNEKKSNVSFASSTRARRPSSLPPRTSAGRNISIYKRSSDLCCAVTPGGDSWEKKNSRRKVLHIIKEAVFATVTPSRYSPTDELLQKTWLIVVHRVYETFLKHCITPCSRQPSEANTRTGCVKRLHRVYEASVNRQQGIHARPQTATEAILSSSVALHNKTLTTSGGKHSSVGRIVVKKCSHKL